MEVSALRQPSLPGLRGPTPLLRFQADERLIALVRRGNQNAFEAIVARYQSRLLAFCRHMLGSREDAEDVLQEVFAAAFNAILADDRPINVRPWLYRIARNRSLNHLRRNSAIGVDSMDVHYADAGQTTGEKVSKREDFRMLLDDIGRLPETQRTALLLREMEALSYQQIAETMETTVPSVKSLLVRARVTLAEAAESRRLTCDEVRLELGAIAEGIADETPPVRRHVRECDRCRFFRGQLRANNRALAAVLPVGPLLLFKQLAIKKLLLAKLGLGGGAGSAGVSTAAGGASTAAGVGALSAAGGTATAGAGAGGILTAGVGVLATKAAAGLAAAAIVTAGAVEARHTPHRVAHRAVARAAAAEPTVLTEERQAQAPLVLSRARRELTGGTPARAPHRAKAKPAKPAPVASIAPPKVLPVGAKPVLAPGHAPAVSPTTQQVSSTTVLPPQPQPSSPPPQQTSASGAPPPSSDGGGGAQGSPPPPSSGSSSPPPSDGSAPAPAVTTGPTGPAGAAPATTP